MKKEVFNKMIEDIKRLLKDKLTGAQLIEMHSYYNSLFNEVKESDDFWLKWDLLDPINDMIIALEMTAGTTCYWEYCSTQEALEEVEKYDYIDLSSREITFCNKLISKCRKGVK